MLLLRLLSLLGLLLFLVLALALVSVFRNKNMYHQLNMCGVIVVVGGGVVVVVAVVVFVVVGVVRMPKQGLCN
jgi:predicted membrane channel-forming protein YqfA (hemolysin III family)